jgi:hypothetical protein
LFSLVAFCLIAAFVAVSVAPGGYCVASPQNAGVTAASTALAVGGLVWLGAANALLQTKGCTRMRIALAAVALLELGAGVVSLLYLLDKTAHYTLCG